MTSKNFYDTVQKLEFIDQNIKAAEKRVDAETTPAGKDAARKEYHRLLKDNAKAVSSDLLLQYKNDKKDLGKIKKAEKEIEDKKFKSSADKALLKKYADERTAIYTNFNKLAEQAGLD